MSDKPSWKKCPGKCKKSKLRRLFGTGAALIFKGSGFYQTDYRSESYKNCGQGGQGGVGTGEGGVEVETKSDAKTEAKPAETKSKLEAGGKSKKK